MNIFYIVTLLLVFMPILLLVRATLSKDPMSNIQLIGGLCLIVATAIGAVILRAMIMEEGDTVASTLGATLAWFARRWGFLYLDGLAILGLFFLRLRKRP